MTLALPAPARPLLPDEEQLVVLATRTINFTTDAGPDEHGVHTMGPP